MYDIPLIKSRLNCIDYAQRIGLPIRSLLQQNEKSRRLLGGSLGMLLWRYDGEQWVLPGELQVINEMTRKRSVVQIECSSLVVIERFNTILDASKETGIRGRLISSCCHGKQRQAGGYIWRYANEI